MESLNTRLYRLVVATRKLFGALGATLLLAGCATLDPTTVEKRYVVEVYKPDKAYPGATIFGDKTEPNSPLIVEVDMKGHIVWFYEIPPSLGRRDGGMDVEWIPNSDHILFTRESGVYEVDRNKEIVWSYRAPVSHDADRLPNGNTLMVWGWGEDSSDPEVREVDAKGDIVWKWHAEKHLKGFQPRRRRNMEGYTHANAVARLKNGNTLISLRNFFMLVEVDRSGDIVWRLEGLRVNPHDPEELPNGNILVNTRRPQVIREYKKSGEIVWEYFPKDADVIRYNHRLPNGNIIFAERRKIVEITPDGEVVWQLSLKGVGTDRESRHQWFYKAERIPSR